MEFPGYCFSVWWVGPSYPSSLGNWRFTALPGPETQPGSEVAVMGSRGHVARCGWVQISTWLCNLRSLKGLGGHLSGIRLSNLPLTHSLWAQQCACLPQPCKDKTEIALPTGNKNRNGEANPCILYLRAGHSCHMDRSCFQHSATWNGNKGLSQSGRKNAKQKAHFPWWMICGLFLSFIFLSLLFSFCPLADAFSIHPCGYRAQVVCVLVCHWHVRGDRFSCHADDFLLVERQTYKQLLTNRAHRCWDGRMPRESRKGRERVCAWYLYKPVSPLPTGKSDSIIAELWAQFFDLINRI